MNTLVLNKQVDLALNGSMVITSVTKVEEEGHYDSDYIRIALACGYVLHVMDAGQSCCERRYLHTDDDLGSMVGETLTQIYVLDAAIKEEVGSDAEHEVQFVHIVTNRQHVVVETHNEHNGYYGGFALRVEVYNSDGTLQGRRRLD
jgi:hypothetical protein